MTESFQKSVDLRPFGYHYEHSQCFRTKKRTSKFKLTVDVYDNHKRKYTVRVK